MTASLNLATTPTVRHSAHKDADYAAFRAVLATVDCDTCRDGCDCEAGSGGCEHYGCWGVTRSQTHRSHANNCPALVAAGGIS